MAIAEMGYQVDAQVGSAGFLIDLAVKHPDQPGSYLMAIECDGAAYYSARWARERDRLRQQVLEDLGWRFHRIWSTDWFRRIGDERRKLKARLDAVRVANPVRTPEPASEPSLEITPQNVPTPNPTEEPSFPTYLEAVVTVDATRKPHEVPLHSMASTVAEIVKVEGPVHEDEIARRVARAYGKDRIGSRISEAVLKGLRRNLDAGVLENVGSFWRGKGQTKCQVRNRANASLTLKRGDMVPPMEIEAAIEFAFDHNGNMTENQLTVAVSRLFGFDRAGPEFKVATNKTIADLIQRGTIKVQDDVLSIRRTITSQ